MAVTNTFSPNTIIKSAEVNDNFTYMTDMIDLDGTDIDRKPANNGDVVVIDKLPRRNHTTGNTYQDAFIQRGWQWEDGAGATSLQYDVTFPKAYSSDTITVVATPMGQYTGAGTPSDEGDMTTIAATSTISTYDILTTGFSVDITRFVGNYTNGVEYGISWIAIGPI